MRRSRSGTFSTRPPRGRRGLATLAAIGATALGLATGTPAAHAVATPVIHASTRPINPGTHLPAGVTPKTTGLRTHSAPAGAHLTYYGGKVIQNVQVIQVLYGPGTYTAEVNNPSTTGGNTIASFYTGINNSTYFDWLSEYNTSSPSQHIGRGSFVGQYSIAPAAANNKNPVDDTNIQFELSAQIAAGHLPVPNANTLYAVHFKANQTITQGGSSSGVAGGFCAYHGTVAAAGSVPEYYYSVLPDFTSGGMTSGCGTGTTFQNETSVSSHELIEAVTDPEVGLAGPIAAPLAWYDSTNGEIGDICNAQQQAIVGGDGRTYTVQQEFSNAQNNCVVSGPATPADFSMSLNPTSRSVAAGSSTTTSVATAQTAGTPGTVSLSATGLPSGVTASFSPASVTAGASSTLTLTAASSTAPGAYTITVTGVEGSKSHTAALSLTVTGGSTGGGGLTNGGFDSGLSGWTSTGATSAVTSGCQAGGCAQVGATSPTNGDSTLSQTFTLPTNGTGVSFSYKMTCPDSLTYDWATVALRDNSTGVTTTPLAKTCVTNAWTQVTAPATAGHSVTLTMISHDDNYASDPSYTLFDSVAVTVSSGGGGGITNGGFETASFSGWTPSGASTAVVQTTPHGGAYDGRAGTTTPTNGDSNIVQVFTVPAGKSQLSFWYKMACPDTVTYDWATATLKNNATSTTTTVLGKTCITNAWTQITASVTAGTTYTLTLTSHDDNYSSDPSYTLFDDVTLN